MTVRELREKYLAFFESKGHLRHPSGSLVPYDVTGRLDDSLLFNGAGMIQFKPYFRGTAQPESKRLTTVQKCVRTGDIEEVGDDTHLTFFEMLGNFSFGDYFKSEAIRFSWEFLTSPLWLGLDPARLSFTVFEIDDEAEATWRECGATRVFRLGEETNYWPAGAFSNGPPGPCGPNSEMFYWVGTEPAPVGEYTREDWIRDDAAGNWVEIWNDVFIQYDWQGDASPSGKGYVKTGMPELPFRSIDTGMGLERTAFVLGGFSSVYDTEGFQALFATIRALATKPSERAERIVADHLRTATFCIGDGILPGNNGRGYVLRRLVRRAVLQGTRALGIEGGFLDKVAEAVIAEYGDVYPELKERSALILSTLQTEEALFRRTLAAGTERLDSLLSGPISGEDAFRLYDTFGFPLEVTQEIADESGVSVDVEGYERAMKEAQTRSRGALVMGGAYEGLQDVEERSVPDAPNRTDFLGYTSLLGEGRIVKIRPQGEKALVALDRTPFYGESGGQVGDSGTLSYDGGDLRVARTTKSDGLFWHEIENPPEADLLGWDVSAQVDEARRARIQRNHTATHLLQSALRRHLGSHVAQAGSVVDADRLRFDFTHAKGLTREEIDAIEREVNLESLKGTEVVTYVDLPIDEARAKGAMALFGEKYGDKVRMVEIGDYSRELCGGTHVKRTSEIGLFRITSESSAAAGVRRIEAVTGEAAYELAHEQSEQLRTLGSILKASDVVPAVERLVENLREEKKQRAKAEMKATSSVAASGEVIRDVDGIAFQPTDFGDASADAMRSAIDNYVALAANRVGLGVTVVEGKVLLVAKAGMEAVARGAHAGNLLKVVAPITGGGGGGRPDFATAGGRDPSKVTEALAAAEEALKKMLQPS